MNRLRPWGICAWSWVNSLGKGSYTCGSSPPESLQNVFARGGLTPHSERWGIAGYSGVVPGPLASLPDSLQAHESRSAQLLWECLAPIRATIEGARVRYGGARIAIVLGSSTGGIDATESALAHERLTGALPPSYSFLDAHPYGALLEVLSATLGISGPALVVSTACSSGGKALASAQRLLQCGFADAVLTGGADALCELTLRGFAGLGVLSAEACRPFCGDRSGISIGEGAALLFLERESEAEFHLLGAGESSDAYHATTPDPEGRGAQMAMEACLVVAGITASAIDYVNAHGTGTEKNDEMESIAIANVLGTQAVFSSTKHKTGHQLGTAGATEALLSLSALNDGRSPPNHFSDNSDAFLRVQPTTTPQSLGKARIAMSNSFAFGGSNVAVAVSRGLSTPTEAAATLSGQIVVRGAAFWSPVFRSAEAFQRGEAGPDSGAPAATLLPLRARGRASMLTRIYAELFSLLRGQDDQAPAFDVAEIPTIYASRFGEMTTTLHLLDQLAKDHVLSPLWFQSSVHNTASGVISVATRNHAFSTALAAGDATFAMALLEAQAWLHCHGGAILVLVADEDLPERFTSSPSAAPLGVGFHLSLDAARDQGLGTLGHIRYKRDSLMNVETPMLERRALLSSATPGVALLHALREGRAGPFPVAPCWELELRPNPKA